MNEHRVAILMLVAALLLPSCTVGPDYERADLPNSEQFRFSTEGVLGSTDTAWWEGFEDPVLESLIDEAISNNIDIRVAAARVDQFAARIGLTRSAAFPQIDAGAGLGRTQNSREIGIGASGGPRVSDFFEANLNAGWELDVFGRIRNATDAAIADMLVAEENRRGVVLSLVTSIATSYIGLLSLDEQLDITRQKLETRRETVELFELQLEKGVVSRLELAQIRSEMQRTAVTVPAIERDIALLENALSVLLGRPPGEISRGRSLTELGSPLIPAGLPSDLLRQRPDLLAAEQRVISENARVGQAIAEFYPRFSLTGSLGLASDDLANFFTSGAATSSVAGGVTMPLFTAGFLENQLEIARATEQEAIESYRAAVLTAFRESEDALITRSTTITENGEQRRQVEALSEYGDLAQQRYDNGFADYLAVLDAERDLFDAELQLARLRAAELTSIVGIYKAFGGGWVAEASSRDSDG